MLQLQDDLLVQHLLPALLQCTLGGPSMLPTPGQQECRALATSCRLPWPQPQPAVNLRQAPVCAGHGAVAARIRQVADILHMRRWVPGGRSADGSSTPPVAVPSGAGGRCWSCLIAGSSAAFCRGWPQPGLGPNATRLVGPATCSKEVAQANRRLCQTYQECRRQGHPHFCVATGPV